MNSKKSSSSILLLSIFLISALSGCQGNFSSTFSDVVEIFISPTPTVLTDELPQESTADILLSPVVPDTATPQKPTSVPATAIQQATMTLTPTLEPISTIIATLFPEGIDAALATPTRTLPPTRTPLPTRTPTPTLTPTPPFAYLHITRPGEFSRLISPYRMEAMVEPGEDGLVRIELIGEDNRLIINEALDYRDYLNRRFWVAPYLEFQIPGTAETARLVMSVEDQFGRDIALSSVDLVLLSLGNNETNPAAVDLEPYLIRYPSTDQVLQGGVMWVSGLARRVNSTPLILELIDEQGKIVGANQVMVPPPTEELSHIPFGVEIDYQVQEMTPVRLTIRQESDGRIPGTIALSSTTIILLP